MLHQERDPMIFTHQIKNVIHVSTRINNSWFIPFLAADFSDFVIMQSRLTQEKQIFVSKFGNRDLFLFT